MKKQAYITVALNEITFTDRKAEKEKERKNLKHLTKDKLNKSIVLITFIKVVLFYLLKLAAMFLLSQVL